MIELERPTHLTILNAMMEGEIVDGTTETVMIPRVTRMVDDDDVTMIDVAAVVDTTKIRTIQRNPAIAQMIRLRNTPITDLESETTNTTIAQTLVHVMTALIDLTDKNLTPRKRVSQLKLLRWTTKSLSRKSNRGPRLRRHQ
jgi:hypothetical protein